MADHKRRRSYGHGTCQGCGLRRGATSRGVAWSHNLPDGRTQPDGRRICPGCEMPVLDLEPPESSA